MWPELYSTAPVQGKPRVRAARRDPAPDAMDASLELDLPDGAAVGREISDGTRTLPVILVRGGGHVHAYLNSCPHAGVRLDWKPDDFRDYTGEFLLCSMHGALFEPATGHCVAGPCRGSRLVRLATVPDTAPVLVIADVEKLPACAVFRR